MKKLIALPHTLTADNKSNILKFPEIFYREFWKSLEIPSQSRARFLLLIWLVF